MNSAHPSPIFSLPNLTPEEIRGLQDYWRVYEQYRQEIDIELMRVITSVPQIKAILQNADVDYLTSPEQQANTEHQRQAIYHSDWGPFLSSLWDQGQLYAHTGVGFRNWFEIVGEFRRLVRPYLLKEYGDSPARLLAALDGADVLIEIMMSTIGDSYLAAKEHLIDGQLQTINQREARYHYMFDSAAVSIWDEDFHEIKNALDEMRAKGISDFGAFFKEHPEFVQDFVKTLKVWDVNQQSLQLFGAASKDELMNSMHRIFLPEALQTFAEELIALAEGQQFFEGETAVVNLQDERLHLLVNIRFDENQLDHTIVSMMDITARKYMEEDLRSSEERFSKAFRASPDAIIISRMTDGVILDVNNSWKTMFGYDETDLIGKSSIDINLYANAEDRDRAVSIIQQQGYLRDFDLSLIHKSGRIRNISLSAEKIDIKGTPCLLTIGRDITEQKQSAEKIRRLNEELEQRVVERTHKLEQANEELQQLIDERERAETHFRGLLESAPDPILVVNNRGKIILINTQFQNTFGYSNEEVLGKTVELLIPERYRNQHSVFRTTFFNEPHSRPMGIGLDLHGLRKDGTEFPVEISLSPLITQDETLVTASIRDITDRRLAEEKISRLNQELEERAAQLEAANKELEAFSYSVSHDLRAPLRTIDGFSIAILEDFAEQLPVEGQNYLMRIRNAAQHMAQLIDDMLNLSRVTRTVIKPEPTDLGNIAKSVIHELQQITPDRNVNVSIAANVVVNCDPRLMKIVLENLLSNAWKFTSKQEHARIEFGVEEKPQGRVYYVRDNGAGFDMTYVNKLFGAFQRLHTTSEFPGIGIGLAIVQRIINRHGGRVWAEGSVGEGATFYFTL